METPATIYELPNKFPIASEIQCKGQPRHDSHEDNNITASFFRPSYHLIGEKNQSQKNQLNTTPR